MSRENIERMREASCSEPAWQTLGIELREISDGFSKVSFKVRPEFLNFVGTLHGGIIVTLADSAFGYALNSLHFPTIASQFNIHFLNPAVVGDELAAECRVIKAGKRTMMAEISVQNQDGKLIAKATGTGIPLDREQL
ncbi:PaaI family thioesterase [Dehalogenimonas etheniformans]|uniref:PaaI family thioesterase n=1 Tax=Dehalogenimonas etheniformans TaxID=1536648 RepID=A0A2P5P981_9CHLR|nr:PaaI family thioesterase [Dehalogenimonas etheniformans]PPD58840.1 PaaI family thioesterase [Dehalogenimonas etheniformans]QNT76390.1 PaaI family thioesterase [Dehalogenimonas etheniformans]